MDVSLFKALSDPTRMKIVSILRDSERCACEFPRMVGKAQPTVSLALKHLVKNGILSSRRDGTRVIYRISDPRIRKLFSILRKG